MTIASTGQISPMKGRYGLVESRGLQPQTLVERHC
jgi:hypothetical protein